MRRMKLFALLLVSWVAPFAAAMDSIELVPAGEPGELRTPFAVALDGQGRPVVVEFAGHRVRRIESDGRLTTLAGAGRKGFGGDGGPALEALFDGMHNLAIAPSGEIYLADTWNSRVRKLDPVRGVVTTLVGTGKRGFSGDGGPADRAEFGNVYCAALDPAGKNLFLADLDNRRIRRVELATGRVSTVAGNGQKGVPVDGANATDAPLVDPRAVAVDAKGNVYIVERGGHALRVVDPRGRIRTVAGTGRPGASGDGGDARQATLNGPKHLCVDGRGDVLIVDTENHALRKYSPGDGRIVRVAGTGRKGSSGVGGPPEQCMLNRPHGVCVAPGGEIYLADSDNLRVLRIRRATK